MTTTTAAPAAPKSAVERGLQLRKFIDAEQAAIAQLMPKGRGVDFTAAQFLSVVKTACNDTPELVLCHWSSLRSCLYKAARHGLMPDGVLGRAYLIPRHITRKVLQGNQLVETRRLEATYQIGYQGFRELALRTGRVRAIDMAVVREGDECTFERGTSPKIHHVQRIGPPADNADKALVELHKGRPIVAAYAVAWFTDGTHQFEVVETWEIDRLRALYTEQKSMGWRQSWPEMACKTASKRLCKRLPMLTMGGEAERALGEAVGLDDMAEVGKAQPLEGPEGDESGAVTDAELAAAAPAETAPPAAPPVAVRVVCTACGESVATVNAAGICGGCEIERTPLPGGGGMLFPGQPDGKRTEPKA